jgi:hypothetical protein
MLIMTARNISRLADISDYVVTVHVHERIIWTGKVTGHPREDGWIALLRRIPNRAENEMLGRIGEANTRE